jgi:hypothetical protein
MPLRLNGYDRYRGHRTDEAFRLACGAERRAEIHQRLAESKTLLVGQPARRPPTGDASSHVRLQRPSRDFGVTPMKTQVTRARRVSKMASRLPKAARPWPARDGVAGAGGCCSRGVPGLNRVAGAAASASASETDATTRDTWLDAIHRLLQHDFRHQNPVDRACAATADRGCFRCQASSRWRNPGARRLWKRCRAAAVRLGFAEAPRILRGE